MKSLSRKIGGSFSSSGGKSSGCVGGSSLAFWMVNLPWDIAMLYSSVWSIASWMSMCLFAQFMLGFTQFSHGSPRMMLSFPHFMAWNSSLWTMVPILMNRVTKCLTFPASFGDPSTLLTGSGFSSFLKGILFLFAKS